MPPEDPVFAPGTFLYIESKIRQDNLGTTFGSPFEWLSQYFLKNAPQYAGTFEKIWTWAKWPGSWGKDKGIDLVAKTKDGKLWAIQSKAYSPDYFIKKSDIDSFLSESNRPCFHFRLLICTTNNIGQNAWETIQAQEKPVATVLRTDLLQTQLNWPVTIGDAPSVPIIKKTPRPHQQEAILHGLAHFPRHDRGQLISACGTGKARTLFLMCLIN